MQNLQTITSPASNSPSGVTGCPCALANRCVIGNPVLQGFVRMVKESGNGPFLPPCINNQAESGHF